MTHYNKTFQKYLVRYYGWKIIYGFIEVGYRLGGGVVIVIATLAALSSVVQMPISVVRSLWTVGMVISVGWGLRKLRPLGQWKFRGMALDMGRFMRVRDGFLNAWELARKPQLQPVIRLRALYKTVQLRLRLRRRTVPKGSPARSRRATPSLLRSNGPAGEFSTGEFGLK